MLYIDSPHGDGILAYLEDTMGEVWGGVVMSLGMSWGQCAATLVSRAIELACANIESSRSSDDLEYLPEGQVWGCCN